ncbi:hypothetical protein BC832DRAFT_562222 [Gaertneriomyces semiglobifer]|nr:hypothetical protein BC832DRAFT_562222 [Gaertneriomyces semiglobifer]
MADSSSRQQQDDHDTPTLSQQDVKRGCILSKLIQYRCALVTDSIRCTPLQRYFKRCPDSHTVEMLPGYEDKQAASSAAFRFLGDA